MVSIQMVVNRRMSGCFKISSRLMTAMSWALVTWPSAVTPVQLAKWVSFMPSSAARWFIFSTNRSLIPATFSASAAAASLPEATHTAFSSSSTVICSPSAR